VLANTPTFNEDGFDEISSSYVVRSNAATEQAVIAAHFPKGRQHSGETMWVRSANARSIIPGVWVIDVSWHGMLGGTIRYLRKVDAQVQQSGSSSVLLSVPGSYPFTYPATPISLQATEGSPVARTNYVTTTAPDLTKVGQTVYSGNPLPVGYPPLPDAPDSGWDYLSDPLWIYPAGWVLDARPADSIHNESGTAVCWFVQDIHAYYQPARPQG
jgi:hypothetical protein